MASYFMNVEQLLKNPKIIEWQIFERTRSSAYLDKLTKLRNYRCFSEFLPQEIARSEQYNAPVSLVLFDVDDFKAYNDRFGHEAGNRALSEIGKLLIANMRKVDVPVRYGGEEFGVILPSTPKAATIGVAERIREAIGNHEFPVGDGTGRLTASIGVAVCPGDATTMDDLVRNADSAMYSAKADGKNRVRFYGDSLRSYPRIDQTLNGSFSSDGREQHPLTTINLSVGGMLFSTPAEVRPGGLLDLRIELPDGRRVIPASGRVVSVERQPGGEFHVATRTVDMNPADRWALVESLRQERSASS
jgi:diguanylate cyclase (GGDEF)-like protein